MERNEAGAIDATAIQARAVSTVMRSARILLLSYLAAACSVSHYSSGAGLPTSDAPPLPHARVHMTDGVSVYELDNVVVAVDSVVGLAPSSGTRIAIPKASVASIETSEISATRTAGLVVGGIVGAAVVGLLILVLALSNTNWNSGTPTGAH